MMLPRDRSGAPRSARGRVWMLLAVAFLGGAALGRAEKKKHGAKGLRAVAAAVLVKASGTDLRRLCQGDCGLIDSQDLARFCRGDCGLMDNADGRRLCNGDCGLMDNADMRRLCQGDCGLIDNADLRRLCRGDCGLIGARPGPAPGRAVACVP